MRQFQKELPSSSFSAPKLTYQIILKYLPWKSYFKEFNADTCLKHKIYWTATEITHSKTEHENWCPLSKLTIHKVHWEKLYSILLKRKIQRLLVLPRWISPHSSQINPFPQPENPGRNRASTWRHWKWERKNTSNKHGGSCVLRVPLCSPYNQAGRLRFA